MTRCFLEVERKEERKRKSESDGVGAMDAAMNSTILCSQEFTAALSPTICRAFSRKICKIFPSSFVRRFYLRCIRSSFFLCVSVSSPIVGYNTDSVNNRARVSRRLRSFFRCFLCSCSTRTLSHQVHRTTD